MNDTDDLRRTMDADQMRANTADLAGIVASFWRGLEAEELPQDVADAVMATWLSVYLERVYWPDGGRWGS